MNRLDCRLVCWRASGHWVLARRLTVQWLVTPAAPVQPPRFRSKDQAPQILHGNPKRWANAEAVAALKAKQAEPLLLATARISATA